MTVAMCTNEVVVRFVSPEIKEKYDLELPEYDGIDQIVEVGSSLEKL
jgi:NAD(P)H-hydrate epimerase